MGMMMLLLLMLLNPQMHVLSAAILQNNVIMSATVFRKDPKTTPQHTHTRTPKKKNNGKNRIGNSTVIVCAHKALLVRGVNLHIILT